LLSWLSLILKAFDATIIAFVIVTAIVVATNVTTAALHRWLVVVSPTPLSAARSVIRRFRHRAIVNTFAAGRCPLSPTFISQAVQSITFAAPVDGWFLHSPPAQQHTN
jgi:hypothetical protein